MVELGLPTEVLRTRKRILQAVCTQGGGWENQFLHIECAHVLPPGIHLAGKTPCQAGFVSWLLLSQPSFFHLSQGRHTSHLPCILFWVLPQSGKTPEGPNKGTIQNIGMGFEKEQLGRLGNKSFCKSNS